MAEFRRKLLLAAAISRCHWGIFWAGPFGPLRLPSPGRASVVAEVGWETLTRFAAATNPPKKFPSGAAAAAQVFEEERP